MENYKTGGERPMTHIEGVISESRNYNSDLRNCISRLDALCTKLGHSNYSKNQPQKEATNQPVKTSDGLLDDLNGLLKEKDYLMGELRISIDYLEQHI